MKHTNWELNQLDKQLIQQAFQEDLGLPYDDVTTRLLFSDKAKISTKAKIISKHHAPLVLSGLRVAKEVLHTLDQNTQIESDFSDGEIVLPGQTLMTLSGPATALLMAERTLLNFLQHLCAVATLTAQFAERIKHTSTKILDTRKTLPGFRHLDKYAVQCGGGVNHRMGLYDALMIKDTHIDALGGIENAMQSLPNDAAKRYPVIVEVRNIHELSIVLDMGLNKITRVLLDNMTPEMIKQCVKLCQSRTQTEASGNIDLDNVASVAKCGVDFISVGKLTHSAGNANLSMICEL